MIGLLPWLLTAWLLGIGLYGIVTSRHYVHLIGCLTVVQVLHVCAAAGRRLWLECWAADLL